jgi:putative hemolysin
MVYYLISILAICISVGGVAFFAGSEISFVSSNRFRIGSMARKRIKGAVTARWLLESPATLLSVTLVGTNICVVLASAIATDLLSRVLGSYSVLISTVGVTGIILVFGEIIPKAIARSRPEVFLSRASLGLGVAYFVLYPIARATSFIALGLARLSPAAEEGIAVTREEIRALVKEATQADIGLSSYAHRVLDLSRMKVTTVMLPMDEVVSIEDESTVSDALVIASRSGHSRYPVYRRQPDNLIGILHFKDLLGAPAESRIKAFVRSGYFVPETKTVKEAIREMRSELRHLGIVADEYGRSIGIVTFEDLVEEIMGEISDEYDRTGGGRVAIGKAISGSTPVSTVNDELGTDIPDGAYDTLAGFILDRAGRVCRADDAVEFGGFLFRVIEVKGKRIKTVRITKRES